MKKYRLKKTDPEYFAAFYHDCTEYEISEYQKWGIPENRLKELYEEWELETVPITFKEWIKLRFEEIAE